MKKLALVLIAASVMGSVYQANAAEGRSSTATASWDAKAIKDTNSMLVVTPIKSLTFNYAEGLERFNSEDGAFDVTIAGQSGASDFKLSSRIIDSTLTRSDAAGKSALTVGVKWNGQELSDSTPVVMVDTSAGISSGLSALAVPGAYAGTERTSAQGSFAFSITKATKDDAEIAFKELPDGYWDGNVNVEFTATWDGTFTD